MADITTDVMTIAGFDPSSGAGINADIKTFEQLGVYGLAVCTANTIQHEAFVYEANWISPGTILKQLDCLFEKHKPQFYKIGIIENEAVLQAVCNKIWQVRPDAKIIWDPILNASSGAKFFANTKISQALLNNLFLITPNLPEMQQLFGSVQNMEILSLKVAVYLKGGHSENHKGLDILFYQNEKIKFNPTSQQVYAKHGSGCVLSAAITAALALGHNLPEACDIAKKYTENFLGSSSGLLGWHKILKHDS
jgi:hydroxymethylpyrimidine/phosphomethylpyrimidine kinase